MPGDLQSHRKRGWKRGGQRKVEGEGGDGQREGREKIVEKRGRDVWRERERGRSRVSKSRDDKRRSRYVG